MDKLMTLGIRKSVDVENRTVTAWASKAVLDRDDEIILGEAWMKPDSTKNFERNPVVLVGHDYKSLPVAKVTKLEKLKEGLKFTAKYAKTSSAEEAFSIVRDLGLAAYSVGFLPKSYREMKLDEVKALGFDVTAARGDRVRVYDHCELLEISHVAIPSNPRATALGAAFMGGDVKSKALNLALGAWKAEVLKAREERERARIIQTLKGMDIKPLIDESIAKTIARMRSKLFKPTAQKETRQFEKELAEKRKSAGGEITAEDVRKLIDLWIKEVVEIGVGKATGRVW